MNPNRYKLSFTGASLEISQSIKIAETYLHIRYWDAVKEAVWEDNLLQARTKSSCAGYQESELSSMPE